MSSKFFEEIIKRSIDNVSEPDNNEATYSIETTDKRDIRAVVSIKLKNPVSTVDVLAKRNSLLKNISENLVSQNLGIVDSFLAELGIKSSRVGKKRVSGNVGINLGDTDEEAPSINDSVTADRIRTLSGRDADLRSLQGTLELLAKEYLIKEMRKPSAPLKYRTGRFANSLRVTSMTAEQIDQTARDVKTTRRSSASRKPRLSIMYTYMTYPYATFDPLVSTRPEMYLRPYYGARNPRALIGEAIAKAARDLLYNGYQTTVTQA